MFCFATKEEEILFSDISNGKSRSKRAKRSTTVRRKTDRVEQMTKAAELDTLQELYSGCPSSDSVTSWAKTKCMRSFRSQLLDLMIKHGQKARVRELDPSIDSDSSIESHTPRYYDHIVSRNVPVQTAAAV